MKYHELMGANARLHADAERIDADLLAHIHAAAAKVPALQRDPGEAIWPNGKRGRDCIQQDFDDVGGWLRALLGAANALTAAADLRLAAGGLQI
jgi:hypothetical protein